MLNEKNVETKSFSILWVAVYTYQRIADIVDSNNKFEVIGYLRPVALTPKINVVAGDTGN